MAKVVSLVVKFGALLFVLKLPATYAIEMQLLGGIWMAQLFPSVVVGVFSRWFNPWALVVGWAAGMASGTGMALVAGAEEFGVSFASACGAGRDVCDVCCGSGFVVESGCFCRVDPGVSRGEDGRGDGCYGCFGLCWLDGE